MNMRWLCNALPPDNAMLISNLLMLATRSLSAARERQTRYSALSSLHTRFTETGRLFIIRLGFPKVCNLLDLRWLTFDIEMLCTLDALATETSLIVMLWRSRVVLARSTWGQAELGSGENLSALTRLALAVSFHQLLVQGTACLLGRVSSLLTSREQAAFAVHQRLYESLYRLFPTLRRQKLLSSLQKSTNRGNVNDTG